MHEGSAAVARRVAGAELKPTRHEDKLTAAALLAAGFTGDLSDSALFSQMSPKRSSVRFSSTKS